MSFILDGRARAGASTEIRTKAARQGLACLVLAMTLPLAARAGEGEPKAPAPSPEIARALHALKAPAAARFQSWPGVADRTLVAWTAWHAVENLTTPDAPDDGAIDLDVAVLETHSGRVMQHLHEPGAWISDAMHFDGAGLDAADYALAPGVRAFGMRASSHHQGCAASEDEVLRLYEIRGGELVRATGEDLVMKRSISWCGCQDDSSALTRTLAIAPTGSHDHADLVLQEKRRTEHAERDDKAPEGCRTTVKQAQRRVVLRFDGRSYAVPADWR